MKPFPDAIISTLDAFFITQSYGSQSTVGKEHLKARKRAEKYVRIASLSVGAMIRWRHYIYSSGCGPDC